MSKYLILGSIFLLAFTNSWAQEQDDEETKELSGYSSSSNFRSGFDDNPKIELEKPDFSMDFGSDAAKPRIGDLSVSGAKPQFQAVAPAAESATPTSDQAARGGNGASAGSSTPPAARQPARQPSGVTTSVTPIRTDPPKYPSAALRRRIEGSVVIEFTVLTDGTTSDIEIVSANPPRVFDREAIRAVSRWTFEPAMVDGTAQTQRIRHTLDFNLQ
ncbi:MAG: TonB family protein [Gammaproteobacteria bacterium]|nr:TonB family protein [Gammaproteobacteria bacterium]